MLSKFIILFLILLQISYQQDTPVEEVKDCGNGCLMCSANSTTQICQICDYRNFYIRYGFVCISNQDNLLNCAVTTDGKNCTFCTSEYYLDETTLKCIKLDTPIENCLYVKSDKTCEQCNTGYYVDENGNCQKIEKNIQNCKIYETGSTCKVCDNSIVSGDKQQCESLNNSTNCSQYSGEIYCSKCIDGYRYLPNKYLVNLQLDSNFVREFNTKLIDHTLKNELVFQTLNDVCIKAIDNCLEFGDDYNQCDKCADGYYYSNNNCNQNPKPKIDNCSEYSTETICKNCLSGYYLSIVDTKTVCIQQKVIDNCQLYSKTVEGLCEECNPSYYYGTIEINGNSETACIKRTITISNCAIYQPTSELCKECRESYELSTSNKQCVLRISKCEQHEFISGSSGIESLICQKCLPGFYIKTNIVGNNITTSCELPQVLIEGCEIYQTETQCVGCKQDYYLANFQCHEHDTNILERLVCKSKSILIQNDCSECYDGQFLYKLYNYCASLNNNIIDKCDTYSSSNFCAQCEANYYYDTTTSTCKEIQIPDCQLLDKTSPKCMHCDLNKSLIPNKYADYNKCVKIPDYLVSNCQDFQFDLVEGTISCKECISGFYPRQFPKRYYSFCVFQTQLSDFRTGLNESNLTTLNNCQSFDFSTKECLYCDQYQDNYLINGSTGECTNECQNDEIAYTFYFQENNPYSFMKCITQNKVQNGNNLENCKRLDFDISIKVSEISSEIPKHCIECLDGYKPVIDEENQTIYARFIRKPYQFSEGSPIKQNNYFSIWNKTPLIKQCYQFDRNSKLISYGNLIGDVKQFVNGYNQLKYQSEDADSENITDEFFNAARSLVVIENSSTQINYIGIKTCQYGFTGVIVAQQERQNDPEYTGYFLNQCVEFSSCNVNVFYTGLCNHDSQCDLYKYQSCSVCSDPTKILTIPYQIQLWMEVDEDIDVTDTNVNVSPFKTNLSQFTSSQKMNLINSCTKKGIVNSSNGAFPSNCAVQLVLNKELYQYTTDLEKTPNPVCIACKPMYKPTLSSTNADGTSYKYIKSCSLIQNCLESNEYNKCEMCKENYVLKYSSFANNQWFTDAQECVVNDIKGCLVGEDNGVCRKCKKGYSLNQAGICDTVTNFEACESAGALNEYNDTYKHLNDYPFRLGCTKCKETMYAVIFQFTPQVCVQNNSTLTHPIGKNFYIQNCQNYQYQYGKLTCSKCLAGYYLTSDYQKCISEEISNCVIYRLEVNATSNDITYFCEQCKEKYYLENNMCFPGKILSCLEYSNKENCTKCEDGNIPTRILNNQYTICFDISNSVKGCKEFDQNEGSKGILKCNKCDNQSYPFLFSLAIKTCARFYQIDHCISYSINDSFQNSSFFCTQCEKAYYALNTDFPSKCQPRSSSNYPINNCFIYTSNADSCDQCISNFFLSADKKQCIANPNGIKNCRVFEDQNTCKECDSGYYVLNKECKEVPEDNLVENCYTYDIDLTCSLCNKEYSLLSNNCQKVVLQNCLVIGYNKVCDQCEEGYVFLNNECQKTNISNCVIYKTSNTCSECEKAYYLANERCINADLITNCEKYVGKKECGECKVGYVLDSGGTECKALTEDEKKLYADSNCHTYLRKVTCTICQEGYVFEPNINRCVACSNASQGCAYCDPLDTTKCLVCQSGKHINSEGKCSDNEIIQVESSTGVEDDLNDFYQDFRGLTSINFISCFLFILFN